LFDLCLQNLTPAALASRASDIHELIKYHCLQQPHSTAIIDAANGSSHSYSQLQAAAEAVSDALHAHPAVGSNNNINSVDFDVGTVVAIALPRGFELVALLLGCMEAGCCWVYLDPSYPGESCKQNLFYGRSALTAVLCWCSLLVVIANTACATAKGCILNG
jgi:acyl-CoA synthetase (AMP-forming)/AMP-acid ligase II